MPSVDVVIPYRPTDHWRERLLGYTVNHWERHFPEYGVIVSDGYYNLPFNRSCARNHGAARSKAEVIIFCDGDTVFANPEDIHAAVEAVHATQERAWFGCSMYFMLCKEFTKDLILETRDFKGETPWTKAAIRPPGGITICGYTAYERVGYYDSRFEGWGYEDSAFQAAMTAMHGHRQMFGDVFHLWHPKPRNERQAQPHIKKNLALYQRYVDAIPGGEAALEEILEERRRDGHLG